MGSENQPDLSESEREVLRVLWDRGPDTVREINVELTRRGRRWAYTTVATLLQRLCAKRYAVSDPSTIPHVFRAAVTRDEILERRLQDAADELCDGRAAPLVLALVQGGRFSAEELARMRRLLDEAAAGRLPEPSKSKAKPRPKSNT
jgi:BlaI family transcriptional regulator, penicillinase repressor